MPCVTQADDRFLSPFNADREVLASMHLPQQVILNDLVPAGAQESGRKYQNYVFQLKPKGGDSFP